METAKACVEIRLLGTPQVYVNGEPAHGFTSDKLRALLAFLAANSPHPYRREVLAGLLWPDSPERAARASLRNALAKLRHALNEPPDGSLLDISYQTVAFRAAAHCRLDLADLMAAGQAELHDPDAMQTAQAAVARYAGPFMDGFTLPDCAEFEEWITVQREHYHRLLVDVLDRLADAYTHRGDFDHVITTLERQLQHAPWREESHRRLMDMLVRVGRRSDALDQFRRCRRVLTTELGVSPDEATVNLYNAIRDESGLPEAATPKPVLPALLTPLVGRVRELAALTALFTEPDVRLVTIVGGGGTGKTHLALAWAHSRTDRYPDGAGFISLVGVDELDHVPTTIGHALGVHFTPSAHPWQQVVTFLRDKRLLLVLDNLEHLRGVQRELVTLLQEAPHVSILATSRRRLHLHCEHVFRLMGLHVPVPSQDGVETTAGDAEAVQLFVARARRVDPHFALTDTNTASVVEICQAVQGLPLGIVLAAGWLEMMTPAEIVAQFERQGRAMFAVLESDAADIPARHRSLWTVIESLWSMLSPRERTVFAGLAVFRGGFDAAAAQAVTGATAEELRHLVAASCVQRVSGMEHARFGIHELLRQFALEQLVQDPQAMAQAADLHAGYFIDFLDANAANLEGNEQIAALEAVALDSENIRVAWSRAARSRQTDGLSRGLDTLCRAYEWQGRALDGEAACQLAAAHVTPADDPAEMRLLARLDAWLSIFCSELGHYDEAGSYRAQALTLLDQLESAGQVVDRERGDVLLSIAQSSLYHDDFAELDRVAAVARAAFQRAGSDWGEAQVLEVMGWAAHNRARYADALDITHTALAKRRRLGDIYGMGWSLVTLGQVLGRMGQLDEAGRALDQAIGHLRPCGDRRGLSGVLAERGVIYTWRGDPERGTVYAAEAAALLREFAMPMWIAVEACSSLADPYLHAGRYTQARNLLDEGLEIGAQLDTPWPANSARSRLAKLALVAGDPARSLQLLAVSMPALRSIQRMDELGDALALRATCAIAVDDLPAARVALQEGLGLAATHGHYPTACAMVAASARFALAQGDPVRALALYAAAAREEFVARSAYFADVYGGVVDRAAEELDPQQRAAAVDAFRGQKLAAVIAALQASQD